MGTSIVTMWTSKGGMERLCLPSSEEEKWSICFFLEHLHSSVDKEA